MAQPSRQQLAGLEGSGDEDDCDTTRKAFGVGRIRAGFDRNSRERNCAGSGGDKDEACAYAGIARIQDLLK